VQNVHASRPERSVAIEPRVELRKRLRAQAVDPEPTVLVYLDKTGVTEDPQVSRGARAGDRLGPAQLLARSGSRAVRGKTEP
jgi:hypothetical protein